MKNARRTHGSVLALATVLAIAVTAWATVFDDGTKFRSFLAKFGSFGNDGRTKRACICNEADPYLRAAGYLDFSYDSTDDVFRARCLLPQPTTQDGPISMLHICSTFTVIP